MALSVEKLLTDAHSLILRLKDHDSMADNIIASTQTLFLKVEAMKQYQDDITELNEIAKHRPRSTLVLGIAQENRQIRELQQENRELQATLEDHQSALELIMQKYREHTVKLLQSNRLEKAIQENELTDKNSMCHLMDKIDEMAGVMQKAIEVDETTGCVDKERLSQLEVENRALRELLEICTTSRDKIVPSEMLEAAVKEAGDKAAPAAAAEDEEDEDTANEDDEETDSSECSSIVSTSSSKKDLEEEAPEEKKPVNPATKKSPERTAGTVVKSVKSQTKPVAEGKKPATRTSSGTGITGVKKAASTTGAKKDNSPTVRKSPSVEGKKDVKGKAATGKAAAGKKQSRRSPCERCYNRSKKNSKFPLQVSSDTLHLAQH